MSDKPTKQTNEQIKTWLIVTNASPLITMAVAGALNTLLLPGIRVVIPDMVRYEVVRDITKPGAHEALEWIKEREPTDVFVASTDVWEEFMILHNVDPATKSKNRGEQAAGEILGRKLAHSVGVAILLFVDNDFKKENLLIELPENVSILSTSIFLDGLKHHALDDAKANRLGWIAVESQLRAALGKESP